MIQNCIREVRINNGVKPLHRETQKGAFTPSHILLRMDNMWIIKWSIHNDPIQIKLFH